MSAHRPESDMIQGRRIAGMRLRSRAAWTTALIATQLPTPAGRLWAAPTALFVHIGRCPVGGCAASDGICARSEAPSLVFLNARRLSAEVTLGYATEAGSSHCAASSFTATGGRAVAQAVDSALRSCWKVPSASESCGRDIHTHPKGVGKAAGRKSESIED